MRAFALAWPDPVIVQRSVGQIGWRHNIVILEKLKDQKARLWYAQKTTVAEYALRDVNKPIGVSTHLTDLLTRSLPDNLKSELPSIEELESQAASVPYPEEVQDA